MKHSSLQAGSDDTLICKDLIFDRTFEMRSARERGWDDL